MGVIEVANVPMGVLVVVEVSFVIAAVVVPVESGLQGLKE